MHASIRRATGKPGSMPEIARILESGYTDRMAQIPGFQAYYVVDFGNDELMTISIFDDESGTEESARAAREVVGGELQPHMASDLTVSSGKVVVHKKS